MTQQSDGAWERRPGEPNLWYSRFERYRLMGPTRSLLAAYAEESAQRGQKKPARNVPGSWKEAADRYRWRERAEAWDESERQRTRQEYETYRRAIMEEGLALDHERVKTLKELAGILADELRQYDRRWVRDVKQIGSGETAERVDIERFNAAEVEQLRGLLDDIAKETGGRQGPPAPGSDEQHPLVIRTVTVEIPADVQEGAASE